MLDNSETFSDSKQKVKQQKVSRCWSNEVITLYQTIFLYYVFLKIS